MHWSVMLALGAACARRLRSPGQSRPGERRRTTRADSIWCPQPLSVDENVGQAVITIERGNTSQAAQIRYITLGDGVKCGGSRSAPQSIPTISTRSRASSTSPPASPASRSPCRSSITVCRTCRRRSRSRCSDRRRSAWPPPARPCSRSWATTRSPRATRRTPWTYRPRRRPATRSQAPPSSSIPRARWPTQRSATRRWRRSRVNRARHASDRSASVTTAFPTSPPRCLVT